MNIESVKTLFTLFSGEEAEKYSPIIALAMSEVEKMLLPDIDTTDIRLDFLCAAMANHRLQQINSARDRTQVTFAGKMTAGKQESVLAYSEKLLRDYLRLCDGLIRSKTFVFMSFSCGEEEI